MIDFLRFSFHNCLNSCGVFSKGDPGCVDGITLCRESLQAIGQQKDGQILVAGTCIKEAFLERSTFIACVDIGKNEAKVIAKTRGLVDFVYASVSADQKLLAFSVRKDFLPKSLAVQRKEEEIFDRWKYQAFVVRLEGALPTEDRWLPVTICHSYAVHVHFLDSENPSAVGLLVLTHKHSIQLHQINVQDADIIHVASSQVLGVAFDWAQWLPHQQCLMYMATPTCPEKQPYAMSCIQFCGSSQYSTVFSISASAIGIRDFFVHDNRDAPSVGSLNKISVGYLNLDVVLWKNGTVCICYQSPPSLRNAWKVSSARDGQKHAPIVRSRHRSLPGLVADSNGGPVESSVFESTYTVTLLHHGCQLQCTHEADCPEKLWPILFLPIDDQHLLVLASGIPSHLLDIDPSHEPLHHIVYSEPCWPFDYLSEAYPFVIPSQGISVLMERDTCVGFFSSVSTERLISLFSCNTSPSNRRSIVHYLAVHSSSARDVPEIFLALQQDVLNIEVTSLLQELLLGRTFAKTKQKYPTCQEILYHLPFTTITTMENEESGLRVTCMYEHLSTDPLLLASTKLDSDADNVWHLLWHYQKSFRKRKVMLSMNSELSLQFDLRLVARNLARLQNIVKDVLPPDGDTCASQPSTKAAFCFSELCTLCSRSNLSNMEVPPDIGEIIQPVTQPFPTNGSDKEDAYLVTSTTWRSIHRFLVQSCPAINNNFVNKVSTSYVSEQVCQSNILCRILFSSFGITTCQDKVPFHFLEEIPCEVLQSLSSLSERYLVAAESLAFPLPDGFQSACTLLVFHATDFLIFMQFVQNGALKLKKDIVLYLLKRMDDSPENIQKKLLLLGHLPKEEGEDVLADSEQVMGSRFYARKKARDLLIFRDKGQPSVQQATEQDVETSEQLIEVAEIGIDANRFT